jgi:hypothetical protein
MLRKLYPVIFLLLAIFLIDNLDSYAQNPNKRRQRDLRNKSRKIANRPKDLTIESSTMALESI